MTVVVWDGKTLAADKRGCQSGYLYTVTKIFRIGDRIVGFAGAADMIGELKAWVGAGRDPAKYPENKAEDGCFFVAITRDGVIERYETSGYPIIVEEPCFAFGNGREYARAAMHLGCDAKAAVEVACLFDESCGNGVDTLTLDDIDPPNP